MKKNKEKSEKETEPEKSEEVSEKGYNDYEKTLIQLMEILNKCETKSDIDSFVRQFNGFNKEHAPRVLVDYIYLSIQNKSKDLQSKQNIDLMKLRMLSRHQ